MISKEDIMASITCGSCKKSHPTVSEVKSCFVQNNNFVPEKQTEAPAKVVKKAVAPVVKNYKDIKTFETREEAEEFVQNNPNSKLKDPKVKHVGVWDEQTQSNKTVTIKTYTVVIY
jgi:hypothetical protein